MLQQKIHMYIRENNEECILAYMDYINEHFLFLIYLYHIEYLYHIKDKNTTL